jgi:hypothetical protein
MSGTAKNLNEQFIDRIDAVLALDLPSYNRYGSDDRAVLEYVKRGLSPEAVEQRADDQFDSGSVIHLHEVAKQRLAPYEEGPSDERS